MSRCYCPKLSRARIAKRESLGSRCQLCGAPFDYSDASTVYCSSACSAEALHRRALLPERVAPRFWSKVNKLGPVVREDLGHCWEWTAALDHRGYGRLSFAFEKRKYRCAGAHRVAWWLEHGRWPEPMALHKCDNPRCVRAEHLFEGDAVENFLDMRSKGRAANGSARVTPELVREIRAALATGVSQMAVASRFGVKYGVVNFIKLGRTWRHVA